jgi:hemolysin D
MGVDLKTGPGASAGGTNALDYLPSRLSLHQAPPPQAVSWVLWLLAALVACTLAWAAIGRLDIVAVADGKLVPQTYLKIVQPPEQGVVREILVREGEAVTRGQVLIRMDPVTTSADLNAQRAEVAHRELALRRIDAQLAGTPISRRGTDAPEAFAQAEAQFHANVHAHENALAQERAVLERARHDLAVARENRAKLEQVLPHYLEQERAYDKLSRDGFAGRLMFTDKQRERIEKEQDLRAQDFAIRSAQATMALSEQKIAQIVADYRRQLRQERSEVVPQLDKLRQELVKSGHRLSQLELRAPADGTVKDLATHTVGTVAAPGSILMTLVPRGERLYAEVWVGNADVGFIRPGQEAKLKLAAFSFQKYGLLDGRVEHVSADASDIPAAGSRGEAGASRDRPSAAAYRMRVALDSQVLSADGRSYPLAPGMQVLAEVNLGTRTVMEYLLSPLQRAFHEAARER